MKRLPHVDFTKSGWKQFSALNRALGTRFVKGFILRRELAEYIGAHYESGNNLDPVCQEVRYEDGVYLLLKQIGSTWYVTDIWATEEPTAFAPMLFWVRVKRGWQTILRQIVIGWRNLIGSTKDTAYGEAIS